MAEAPLERPAGPRRVSARLHAAASTETGLALLTIACLAVIVLAGSALRFRDIGWDQPAGAPAPIQMHPDERYLSIVQNALDWPDSIGGYFDSEDSPLNPYNTEEGRSYVYGTLPLFAGKALATIAGDDPGGPENSYDSTVTWGRRLTALVDTLTIVLVFGIGAVAFGRAVGLGGAGLYALAVLPTQLAHFWTMDPYFTFFGAATLLLCLLAIARDSWWALPLAGVTIGLAMACKVNAGLLGVLPVLVVLSRIGLRDFYRLNLQWRGQRILPRGNWALDGAGVCFAAIGALIAFRLAAPYAFTGTSFFDFGLSQHWLDVNRAELNRQNGNEDFPPFVQFAGNPLFWTPLKTMVLWGLGPALGLTAVVAGVVGGVLLFRRRELTFLLPLTVVVVVFAFHGARFVAFMRYFEPIYPALCVLAGWALVAAGTWAVRGEPWRATFGGRSFHLTRRGVRVVGASGVAAAVLGTAFWALAFQNIYTAEHPRIAASAWIHENVPPGSTVTYELWDDSLPYGLPGRPSMVIGIETDIYRTDSTGKIRDLVYGEAAPDRQGLAGADYVVISSNRVRDSVNRLEREYPATLRYYELLDSGALGFERVATFRVEPSFLGISIPDQGAEESFTVYDHPEVRIYQKTAAWDADRAFALLLEGYPDRAVNLLPKQGATNGLQYTPAEAAEQQAGGTWSDVFDPGGWGMSAPWLALFLWIQVGALAAVPWVTWLFRALPDRGYGLSKVAGQVAVSLGAWMLVAWDVLDFSRALVWAVFLAAVAVGAGVAWFRRRTLLADARDRWRTIVAVEAVFLVAFLGFLALRAANPDLWFHPTGGEKPMEVAYLTAVARSTEFPPYDPWFAGGYLNYYAMGWFFMAVPMRAFQIVPETGFNLGVPMFASLAAATAFSTLYNLVAISGAGGRGVGRGAAGRVVPRAALVAGLLGAFFLVAIGNLDGLHQTVERLQAVNTWSTFSGVPVVGGAVGIGGGLREWLFGGAELPRFDWWRSSRVHFGSFDITEFPYWSFLFSDVHPHLMGIPFFGLVVATAAAYIATVAGPAGGSGAARGPAQGWLLAAFLGLLVGLMRTVHTWDFPTVVLIGGAAIATGQVLNRAASPERRVWLGVSHAVIAAALAVLPFQPFTAHFETFSTSLQRTVETTEPQQYFAHFGIFVSLAVAFIATRYAQLRRTHHHNVFVATIDGRFALAGFATFIVGLTVFTWPIGVTVVALSSVIVLLLGNLVWVELRARAPDPGRLVATAALLLAFAIAAGVDVVRVGDDIERMNTVFKFSNQAWHLFALGSAYAAWYVWDALGSREQSWQPEFGRRWPGANRYQSLAGGAAGLLVLAGSIFLWSGTRERQDERFFDTGFTLDGLAYLQHNPQIPAGLYANLPNDTGQPITLTDDLPMIEWLRDNVEGTPVIVEAPGTLYTWGNRVAINTGLPAVIGWDNHQRQQRTDYAHLIDQRRQETTAFYTGSDTTEAGLYLRQYNVRYVIVGIIERAYYPAPALAKFDAMPALEVVFRDGAAVVYEVDPAKLPVPE